jgi:hypothetical protein
MQIHTLTVPDELLAWGKDIQRAHSFARPWAHELERLIAHGQETPLDDVASEMFINRYEALCHEAVRHGRHDLLAGVDLFSAEWMGLKYTFETSTGRTVSFGRGGRYAYGELRAVLKCPSARERGEEAFEFLEEVKDLLSDSFPKARIGAMMATDEASSRCADCGTTEAFVYLTQDTGSVHCGACWKQLTEDWPKMNFGRGKKR